MTEDTERISAITVHILDEIFIAIGFCADGWQRRSLWPIFWLPARLAAKLLVEANRSIETVGIQETARRYLSRFVKSTQVFGADDIPKNGPLLVASNHPGAYDALIIISNLIRDDLKFIISDVPVFRTLPALDRNLIYVSRGTHGRMSALRAGIQHLEAGGTLLIYPSGIVDPDPDLFPNAGQELANWSPSIELFLRKVPEAKIQLTIVSGVLSPAWLKNPLSHLPKTEWRQRKLAEFFQVMQQLFFPGSIQLVPRISFGPPMTVSELINVGSSECLLQAIKDQARILMTTHTTRPSCAPQSG